MSDEPEREQLVDPADFVGEPPAGDAYLDDFVSNDQSAGSPPTDGDHSDDADDADESEDES